MGAVERGHGDQVAYRIHDHQRDLAAGSLFAHCIEVAYKSLGNYPVKVLVLRELPAGQAFGHQGKWRVVGIGGLSRGIQLIEQPLGRAQGFQAHVQQLVQVAAAAAGAYGAKVFVMAAVDQDKVRIPAPGPAGSLSHIVAAHRGPSKVHHLYPTILQATVQQHAGNSREGMLIHKRKPLGSRAANHKDPECVGRFGVLHQHRMVLAFLRDVRGHGARMEAPVVIVVQGVVAGNPAFHKQLARYPVAGQAKADLGDADNQQRDGNNNNGCSSSRYPTRVGFR